MKIEQGRCYLADLNPARKSKPGKIRPVIVIQSTDIIDAGSPGIVIVPMTTKTQTENILRVRITPSKNLKIAKTSDVLIDQIHTLDRCLLLEDLGEVATHSFTKIQHGVRFLLNL